METSDKQFFLTFMGVLGALVLIAVLVWVAAQILGGIGQSGEKSAAQLRIAKERIEPVGKLNLKSSPDQPAAAVADASASQQVSAAPAEDVDPGKKAYSGICQSCHLAGVAGAPKLGDVEAWRPRIAQGMDAMYMSVINGKGVMPPRGGAVNMSDDEIRAAVGYMVNASR